MKTRFSTSRTLLASLVATVALGLTTAAVVFAEPGDPPPFAPCAPLPLEPLDAGLPSDGTLQPEPIGPVVVLPEPDTEPTPDPTPEPDVVDPDSVIVLKPGETYADIDADGRLTGNADYKKNNDDEEQIVLIVSGRTLDEYGKPVAGARVDLFVDLYGMGKNVWSSNTWNSRERSSLNLNNVEFSKVNVKACKPPRGEMEPALFILPTANGFSDKHGNYRIRISYHAKPGANRDVTVSAHRAGFLAGQTSLSGLLESHVDIKLGKPATLSGRCVDERGMPVAGVGLYAYGDLTSAQAVSDAQGRFSLEGLTGGTIYISGHSDEYLISNNGSISFDVRAGEENEMSQDLQLTTRTSATFELRMNADETSEAINGHIEFIDDNGRVVFSTYFNCIEADGAYIAKAALDGLASGSYEVRVHVNGLNYWRADLRVSTAANMANELGTIYLMETDAPAANTYPTKKICRR